MLKKQLTTYALLTFLGLTTGLIGCTTTPKAPVVALPPGNTLEASPVQRAMIHNLEANGVQVFRNGGTILIVLSSDRVFHADSANLDDSYLPTLDLVANLLNSYQKEDVRVQAYTDNLQSKNIGVALSTRQAQVVINYLWVKGSDSRLMYAIGSGQATPVAANDSALNMQQNRRVVISFKFYPKVEQWN